MDAHPCFRVHHPCVSGDLGWSMDGARKTIYLRLCAIHVPSTFLRLELSMSPLDSSRRADHFAPNESSVAQMGAELWPETCFGWTCIQNVKLASIIFSELGMIIHVCITGLSRDPQTLSNPAREVQPAGGLRTAKDFASPRDFLLFFQRQGPHISSVLFSDPGSRQYIRTRPYIGT